MKSPKKKKRPLDPASVAVGVSLGVAIVGVSVAFLRMPPEAQAEVFKAIMAAIPAKPAKGMAETRMPGEFCRQRIAGTALDCSKRFGHEGEHSS